MIFDRLAILLELLLEISPVRVHKTLINNYQGMEPMAGIEPATDGLRNRCSTTELHWLNGLKNKHVLPLVKEWHLSQTALGCQILQAARMPQSGNRQVKGIN